MKWKKPKLGWYIRKLWIKSSRFCQEKKSNVKRLDIRLKMHLNRFTVRPRQRVR